MFIQMQLKVGSRILVLTQPNKQYMALHTLSLRVAAVVAAAVTVVVAARVACCLEDFPL